MNQKKCSSARDLLAGSSIIHEVEIPGEILAPGSTGTDSDGPPARMGAGKVRIKPLSVAVLTLIARAARDDESLVPLLMIKEALVEPQLTLEQIGRFTSASFISLWAGSTSFPASPPTVRQVRQPAPRSARPTFSLRDILVGRRNR